MIKLSGQELHDLPLGELLWKRDLLYFEGPLLSEFLSDKGEVYLKYWCDCDNEFNRWMVFKIKEQDRLRLVLGEKSLFEVIETQPDSFVFVLDESEQNDRYMLLRSEYIPDQYMPEIDSYLDVKEYVEDENISSLVFEDQWEFEELKDVFKKFTQIYDFIFVSNKSSGSIGRSLPWQGGYSSYHFYNKLKSLIPYASQNKLNSIHYASPGYMKMSLDSEVSNIALKAIENYSSNKDEVDIFYSDVANKIRDLRLNSMSSDSAVVEFESNRDLLMKYNNLVSKISGFDKNWLQNVTTNEFERCKIVMAHTRKLKSFHAYLKNGSVRVVSSLISEVKK